MAGEFLFADSFEHYGSDAALIGPYAISSQCTISSLHARSGTKSLAIGTAFGSNNLIRRVLKTTHTNLVVGWCPWLDAPMGNNLKGLRFRDASAQQIGGVLLNPDNSISVVDRLGVERGTSRPLIFPGVFHHIECNIRYAPSSAGILKVKIDGNTALDIDASALDLGSNPIAMVECGQPAGGAVTGNGMFLDDWYGFDGDDFKGQVVMRTDMPDADGPDADWAVTGAASTFDAINEIAPDSDTTCITASVIGDKSSVGFPNAPANVSAIKGVFLFARAKTTEPGDAKLRIDCNSGGTVEEGEDITLFSSYSSFDQGFHLDPDTGDPWEPAGYNAMLAEYVKSG